MSPRSKNANPIDMENFLEESKEDQPPHDFLKLICHSELLDFNFLSLSNEYEARMNKKELDERSFIKSENSQDVNFNFTPFVRQGVANKHLPKKITSGRLLDYDNPSTGDS